MKTQEEMISLLKDPKMYLESFVRIKGKTPGLIPFILKSAQVDLFNTLAEHDRVMILKARQGGFTTAATGYFYHKTITTPGTNTAIIGYNADLTKEILDKIQVFHKTTPASLRPELKYNSKSEMSFPKIDSKIIVLPSTENVGRGYTLHNVLCTELASWEKAEEKMYALEAAVPIDGQIICESTPQGVGNLYHRMWMAEDNGYVKKEYGWWWYYTREEIEKIKKRMNNPLAFAQEYGLEFLATGRSVFDQNAIRYMRKGILKVGDKNSDGDEVYEENGWRIYKKPKLGGLYVCGADVAEGVAGGDYSVASIWDRRTGEEVAFYRGQIPPDMFALSLNEKGRWYNNALMVVEVNNSGIQTIGELRKMSYPSMYFRPSKFESLSTGYTDKMGWRTTKLTRTLLILDFDKIVRDRIITIHSKELLDEMLVFIYNDNNDMVPQSGFHDDCIFSAGIAFQGFKIMYDKPLDQLNSEEYLPVNFSY